MPPTPHRRGISVPDAVLLATEAMYSPLFRTATIVEPLAEEEEPISTKDTSKHSRRNSPTSVLVDADHPIFSAAKEDDDHDLRREDVNNAPPYNDGAREDVSHPLLRGEPPSVPEAKRRQAVYVLEPASAHDDLALPSRPSPRSHRRCQTDPGVQKLQFRTPREDDVILDGLRECLKELLSDLGDAHPRVGLLYNHIGTFHFRRRDFELSEGAYHEALRCYRAAFRSGHGSTSSAGHGIKGSLAVASTLANVGACHWKTGRLHSAVAYLEEALRVQENVAAQVQRRESFAPPPSSSSSSRGRGHDREDDAEYGGGSVEMAETLHNLGIARTLRGDHRSAKRTLLRSLRMFERHCGPYHVDVARVQDALASLYALRGKPRKALECHVAALRIKSAILNAHHPSLLGSMMKVAAGHRALGQLDEAEGTLREVLECQGVVLLRSVDPTYRRSMTTLVGGTMRMIGEVQRERNGRAPHSVGVRPAPPPQVLPTPEDDDACTLSFSVSDDGEEGSLVGVEEAAPSFHGSADDWGV